MCSYSFVIVWLLSADSEKDTDFIENVVELFYGYTFSTKNVMGVKVQTASTQNQPHIP